MNTNKDSNSMNHDIDWNAIYEQHVRAEQDKGSLLGTIEPKPRNEEAETRKKVKKYLELHEQQAKLKKEMDELKEEIRGYMNANDLDTFHSRYGSIVLQQAKKSNSTSRYSDYELGDVMTILKGSDLKQVTEIRVNSEKVEGLIKLGNLPNSKVEALKNVKIEEQGNPRFTVKR